MATVKCPEQRGLKKAASLRDQSLLRTRIASAWHATPLLTGALNRRQPIRLATGGACRLSPKPGTVGSMTLMAFTLNQKMSGTRSSPLTVAQSKRGALAAEPE